ncbi:hypothetical protein ACL02T_22185 [Pseudonocardia sp. RS010]|uniref:hypothetical protein n=1 Tax=Pseudonocardia sp. RS010 TaxID=3385979 RepID=UPI0039A06852
MPAFGKTAQRTTLGEFTARLRDRGFEAKAIRGSVAALAEQWPHVRVLVEQLGFVRGERHEIVLLKMIPAIFGRTAITEGHPDPLAWARRASGAAIGLISAVGALGGLLINLAFRQSFATTQSGIPAFWAFLAFYAVCSVVTYLAYTRQSASVQSESTQAAPVRV